MSTHFMSSLMQSIHCFLDLPWGCWPSGSRLMAVFTTQSSLLHTMCPCHLRLPAHSFATIAATPLCCRTSSFMTWLYRVSPRHDRTIKTHYIFCVLVGTALQQNACLGCQRSAVIRGGGSPAADSSAHFPFCPMVKIQ